MFKYAITTGKLTINNPSIWRPILDIRDCVSAYIRAIQADYSISGVFNIASDNYTIGQIGDYVSQEIEQLTAHKIELEIKNVHDLRNYKVTCNLAKTKLVFQAQYNINDIINILGIYPYFG